MKMPGFGGGCWRRRQAGVTSGAHLSIQAVCPRCWTSVKYRPCPSVQAHGAQRGGGGLRGRGRPGAREIVVGALPIRKRSMSPSAYLYACMDALTLSEAAFVQPVPAIGVKATAAGLFWIEHGGDSKLMLLKSKVN